MATIGSIFIPDYVGAIAPPPTIGAITYDPLIGTIASGASKNLFLGKYRLFKVNFLTSGAPAVPTANNLALRFTTGISTGVAGGGTGIGATVPLPTAASPTFMNNQENIFELDGSIDSIAIANLTTDNGTLVLNYIFLPLARA